MLNWIIAASLRNRMLVACAALLVAAYGLFTGLRMPIDVLPDLNRPVVTILTEAHGMVPEDVERLVTWPVEQVLNGATGVYRVRSQSGTGLSVVYVEFEWGTDIYLDRQIVAEKLQLAEIPPGVQAVMAPISSIMGQTQLIGFYGSRTDPFELRSRVDRDIKPRILSLSGIAQVVTIGSQPSELQVIVDTGKLRAFDVTLDEVAGAVNASNVNVSGGYFHIGPKGPLVTVPGLLEEKEDLQQAIVRHDPLRSVRVRDVADVVFGPTAVPTGDAGINGEPGVIMVIMKQPGIDTVGLTDRINAELERIQKELPEDVKVENNLFQQAAFIHRAIDNVIAAVRDGAILVVIILFLFLLNFRTTFITLTAIPLSVAIAALVFAAFGLTINTMTLGGLAVAIGTLVDDAIVDVENVFRRLHQNAQAKDPEPPLWVVFRASSEIRKPVLYGTLLVTVVYLPIFFLGGIEGRLFAPIGLAYIISILASLLVALTLTPVLCYYLLGHRSAKEPEYGGWLIRHLRAATEKSIRFSIKYLMHLIAALGALVLVCLALFASRGSSFLPEFNEGSAQVNLVLPPDTSLETSNEFGLRLEKVLMEIDGIQHVGRRTGRAAGDEHAMPVSLTETIVTFDQASPRPRNEIIEEIRERLAHEFPGVAASTEQPIAHLLSHLLSGVTAQVAIKIYGPDLDQLRRTAKEVETAIKKVDGVRDLYIEPQILIDQVEVRPYREALARFGLNVEDVANTVELAMGGEEVSRMQEGQVSYPITVRLKQENRRTPDDLKNLYLRKGKSEKILLSDVADVRISKTPNLINRENMQRRVVVQHNVGGRSLGEVVADVQAELAPIMSELAAKPGYSIRISGQFEAQEEATRMIFALSFASLAAMFLILFLHFRSANLAIQVLVSLPMAFVGAVGYVVLSGQVLSIATLVGLIALGGIAARNGILLLDHYLHLMQEEGQPFSTEMIVRAGQERMVPVLMTALCSGIGLVPLALTPDQPGREILYPVATVIIGGLLSSTLLDFLVRPGLFWTFGRKEAERLAKEYEPSEEDATALKRILAKGVPPAPPEALPKPSNAAEA
ncbi:MAG: efflux RND transporter permease subunit [Planctomycetes bacterium]|nr:efflux RND transporter permease subunit [Planctomycetota bacterium]